jgi:hypothetical protein
MLRRVALVRTNVSKDVIASIIRVTGIGEIGIILAVTSNRSKLRGNTAGGRGDMFRNVGFYKNHTA